MEEVSNITSVPVSLSAAAAKHIKKVISDEKNPALMVRLEVLGGGCSGYQYRFNFDTSFNPEEDVVIERDSAKLIVDKTSLELLHGSEVDFGESLMEAGFRVNNPNASSSCGCGTSFAIESK